MADVADRVLVLVLDLAGVLARFDHGPRLAALARLGGLDAEEVEEIVYGSGFVDAADGGALDADGVRRGLRERLGGLAGADDADLDAAWMAAFAPDEEVLAVVDDVRRQRGGRAGGAGGAGREGDGVVVTLLSSNDALVAELLPAHLPEVARRLDLAFLSGVQGVGKPAAEAYEQVLRAVGAAPGAAVLVDDTPANVDGARAAGLSAVPFTTAAALRADLEALGLLAPTA